MVRKLDDLKDALYTELVKHPAKSDYQLAVEFKVSRGWVYNQRNKWLKKLDFELARNVAGAFLNEFQHGNDYFKLQIDRLEERKEQIEDLMKEDKIIFKRNLTGQSYPEAVPLDPRDKADMISKINDIERQQTDLWKQIIVLARQSEAVQVMRMIQSGRIKLPDTTR